MRIYTSCHTFEKITLKLKKEYIFKSERLGFRSWMKCDLKELKAGKAIAAIVVTENNKIKLKLNWVWLTDDRTNGKSEYIEL